MKLNIFMQNFECIIESYVYHDMVFDLSKLRKQRIQMTSQLPSLYSCVARDGMKPEQTSLIACPGKTLWKVTQMANMVQDSSQLLTYLSRSVLMPSRCLTVEQSTEADVDYFSVLRGLYSSSNFTKFTLSDRITVIMSTQFLSDTVDNVERILILLLERRHLKSQIQSYSRPS